ncbi:squalene-hopene cyclase [Brachionus plicatilis]|uniref:Squalene-hopene cyclase n=1 Tax=Brachionus plicatilis TaxID=10195 RepID=A0A3M7QEE6_BRAPC|nr:squalene-hopene cyclase [Brachionus plicatilis]
MNTLDKVLESVKQYVWKTQKDSTYWLYAPYLGSFFISQYYLVLNLLDATHQSKLNAKKLSQILLQSQRKDGGWYQVPDPNNESSHLDATIFNYWFLKASESLPADSEVMTKAKEFILNQGGLQSASHMTKIWLCLFGQYEWSELASIPLFAFRNDNIYKYSFVQNWVAQWVYPHILPIAYLRNFNYQKCLGKNFDVQELNGPNFTPIQDHSKDKKSYDWSVKNLVEKIHLMRRPQGTYGAYSVSTLFTLIVLKDYQQFDENINENLFKKSIDFIEELYLNSETSSYLGVLDDGRWWDTLLITMGLLECDEERNKLEPSVENFLKNAVQECGGIPYGLDFEYAPDTDDTGIMALILAKYYSQKYPNEIRKANEWLISMQNNDGGFGAFAKGNYESTLIKLFAGKFQNSAEIFDASSVDVTAHILEGWAESGYTLKDKHVQMAIQYLKNQQTSFGAWEGRWGVNYIYAVGSVVPAMAKIEGIELMNEKWILKSIDWLVKCQNLDGGFGESTQSYVNKEWIGRGQSTASQTAWAILALIEAERAGYSTNGSLKKAVDYLVNIFCWDEQRWFDSSSVGTGHRRLLYMQYPVYSIAWPMIALGRYKNLGK